MNNLLELKGRFEQRKRNSRPGPKNLPNSECSVTIEHLTNLLTQLTEIQKECTVKKILNDCIFSIYYTDIIAKSNRAQTLFSKNVENTNSTIVGAKFVGEDKKCHVITHRISQENMLDTLHKLEQSIYLAQTLFGEHITYFDIEKINKGEIELPPALAKTKFIGCVVDCYFIDKFDIEYSQFSNTDDAQIVTLYDTGIKVEELMQRIGINDFISSRKIGDTTVLLYPNQLKILQENASFLVSMAVTDMATLNKDNFNNANNRKPLQYIPSPKNEPIVGVIDTMFDENVYFTEWVEPRNKKLNENIQDIDYSHGTKVTSIIVDGPSMNKHLEDNCGRFRVRHFGVTPGGRFSSFAILNDIQKIVKENPDIKVWNLSLGSALEVNQNFISPEAAILDDIQYENDVIFIVAGTNKPISQTNSMKIGAPADSINSIVVNAVDENGKPTNYSREGIVLSFFNKPDIAYYGGTNQFPMMACDAKDTYYVSGTSYAAPWITRKVAYLIHKMGLSREIAKALLIDSAVQWQENTNPSNLIGFGVVPKLIDDIVKSQDDEIRFVVQGTSELYDTYTSQIPVPIYQDKQPYIAKATLCYFPKCKRSQGVDYTCTEIDLHFGRIKPDGRGIMTINDNKQNDDDFVNYLKEGKARLYFRKWDNVKHICERLKSRGLAKNVYGEGLWGLSMKTVERLNGNDGKGLHFGIVVTLKEIKGVNRFQDFKYQCFRRSWLVNEIIMENRIEIYNKAEEEIILDD